MAKLIRRVRTPGGSKYYGLPIGSIITPDIIQAAKAKHGGTAAPKGATSIRVGNKLPDGQKPASTKKGYEAEQSAVEAIKAILDKNDKLPKSDKGLSLDFKLGGTDHKLPTGSKVLRSANHADRIAYVQTPDGQSFRLVDEKVELLQGDIKKSIDSIFEAGGDDSKFKPLTTVDEDTYLAEADPKNSPYLDAEGMSVGDSLTNKTGLKTLSKTAENEWTDSVTGFKRDDKTVQALIDFGSFGVGGKDVPDNIEQPTNLAELLGDDADIDDYADYLNGLPNGQKAQYDDGTSYTKVEDGENDRWVNDADETDELSNEDLASLAPIVELQPTPDIPEDAPETQDDEGKDLPEEEIDTPPAPVTNENLDEAEATAEESGEPSGKVAPQLSLDTPLTAEQLDQLPEKARVRVGLAGTFRKEADGSWKKPGLDKTPLSSQELAEQEPKLHEISTLGTYLMVDGAMLAIHPNDGSEPYVAQKKITNPENQDFDLIAGDETVLSVEENDSALDDFMDANKVYNDLPSASQVSEKDDQDELDEYLDEQFNTDEDEENGLDGAMDAANLDELPEGTAVIADALDEDGQIDEENPEQLEFKKNVKGYWENNQYATPLSSEELTSGFFVGFDSVVVDEDDNDANAPEADAPEADAPSEPEATKPKWWDDEDTKEVRDYLDAIKPGAKFSTLDYDVVTKNEDGTYSSKKLGTLTEEEFVGMHERVNGGALKVRTSSKQVEEQIAIENEIAKDLDSKKSGSTISGKYGGKPTTWTKGDGDTWKDDEGKDFTAKQLAVSVNSQGLSVNEPNDGDDEDEQPKPKTLQGAKKTTPKSEKQQESKDDEGGQGDKSTDELNNGQNGNQNNGNQNSDKPNELKEKDSKDKDLPNADLDSPSTDEDEEESSDDGASGDGSGDDSGQFETPGADEDEQTDPEAQADEDLTPDETEALESTLGDDPDNFTPDEQNPEGDPTGDNADVANPGVVEKDKADKPEATTQKAIKALQDEYAEPWMSKEDLVFEKGEVTQESISKAPVGLILEFQYQGQTQKLVKLPNGLWFDGENAFPTDMLLDLHAGGTGKFLNPNELPGFKGIANELKGAKKKDIAKTYGDVLVAQNEGKAFSVEGKEQYGDNKFAAEVVDGKLVLSVNDTPLTKDEIAQAYKALNSHSSAHVTYGLQDVPSGHPLADMGLIYQLRDTALLRYPNSKPKAAALLTLKEAGGIQDAPLAHPKGKQILVGEFTNKKVNVQGPAYGFFSIDDIQDSVAILDSTKSKQFKSVLTYNLNAVGNIDPTKVTGGGKDKDENRKKFSDYLQDVLATSALVPTKEQYVARLNGLKTGHIVLDRKGGVWTKNQNGLWTKPGAPTAMSSSALFDDLGALTTFVSQKSVSPSNYPVGARLAVLEDTGGATLYKRDLSGNWVKVFEDAEKGQKTTFTDAYLTNLDTREVFKFTTDNEDIVAYDPDTGEPVYYDSDAHDNAIAQWEQEVSDLLYETETDVLGDVEIVQENTTTDDASYLAAKNTGTAVNVTDDEGHSSTWVKGPGGDWIAEYEPASVYTMASAPEKTRILIVDNAGTIHQVGLNNGEGVVDLYDNNGKTIDNADAETLFQQINPAHNALFVGDVMSIEDFEDAPVGTRVVMDTSSDGTMLKPSEASLLVKQKDGNFYSDYGQVWTANELDLMGRTHFLHSHIESDGSKVDLPASKTNDELVNDFGTVTVESEPISKKGKGGLTTEQASNAEYLNENTDQPDSIKPGKYSTPNATSSYMVVHEDGTGTYYNKKGEPKKLTKNAVKKNAAIMTKYHGEADAGEKSKPESTDVEKAEYAKSLKKDIKKAGEFELADGTYYSGDQTKASGKIFEVKDGQIKAYSPMLSVKVGGNNKKVGTYVSTHEFGDLPPKMKVNVHLAMAYAKEKYYPISYAMVSDDGKKLGFFDKEGKELGSLAMSDMSTGNSHQMLYNELSSGMYLSMSAYVADLGGSKVEKATPTKNALKKLALTGGLIDGYGNSIVPDDYLGQIKFLGSPISTPDLVKLKTQLDAGEIKLTDIHPALSKDGDDYKITGTKAAIGKHLDQYAVDHLGMDASTMATTEELYPYRQKAMAELLDAITANLSTETPKTDAMALFEKDELGNPKKPLPTNLEEIGDISSPYYASTGQLSKYIKQISDSFGGGGIIGLHYTKMDKNSKINWINALKAGEFHKMYQYELNAAAKEGKPHGSGFLHPGYTGNVETHNIKYGPAVPGEKLASEKIEGNWSSSAQIASAPELDNYLILATMQNPEYLSLAEKRNWVHHHRNGNQEMVDNLSELALVRAKGNEKKLSDKPIWTDNVEPAKSYTKLFDETPHPINGWNSTAAKDYLTDHPELHEKALAFVNETYGGTYTSVADVYYGYLGYAVQAHFQELADIEYQKSLIPVYHLDAKQTLVKGTHPAFNVSDQFDNHFIYKPRPSMTKGEKYRAEAEHAANLIGRILGFQTAKSQLVEMEINGETKYGQMQSVIPNVISDMNAVNLDTLTPQQIQDVTTEHMLDWLLDNDDTHLQNLLLNANGRLIGIDKGRAFKHYGAWKGLDPQAMNSNATTVYSLLYDRIGKGKYSKEDLDQAYLAARKRVMKMATANNEAVQKYLAEGMKNRTSFDVKYSIDGKAVPNTYEGLVQAVMHRKAGLVEDFDKVWGDLYKKAKYGDLPEAPVNVLPNELASGLTDQSHVDKAFLSKSVGHSTFIGGANVIGGNATSWTEKGQNNETYFHSEMYLAPKAQADMTKLLQTLVDPTTVGNASSSQLSDKYLDTFVNAAKTVNHHAADGQYNEAKISAMKNMLAEIEKDMAAVSDLEPKKDGSYTMPSGTKLQAADLGQYVLMSEYYQEKGAQILQSMDVKEKVKPHITGYTILTTDPKKMWTHPDGSKLVSTDKGTYIHLDSTGAAKMIDGTDSAVVAIIAGENGWVGQAVDTPKAKESPLSHLKVKLNAKTYEVASEVVDGEKKHKKGSSAGSQSGSPGKEYEITLPTGEKIFYRNTDKTSSQLAHQGKLTAKFETTDPEDAAVRMQHIQDALEELGLDVTPADMTSLELSYWREQYGVLINRGGHANDEKFWANAKKELLTKANELGKPNQLIENLNAELGNEGEVQFWREFWAKYMPKQVEKLIAEDDFLPTFKHQSLDDPELETGKPIFMRLDWREEYQKILATNNILTHHAYSMSYLPQWIAAGGLLSSEERLRSTGFFNAGMSSSSDQGYGSSHSLYTRIQKKSSTGWHVMFNPKSALAARTYSAPGDTFGQLSVRNSSAPHEVSTAFQKYAGGGNETMVPHTLSFLDDIELIVADDAQQRDYLIQELKKRGITEIRGVPVEDRIVLSNQRAAAVEKLTKLWKEELND